MPTRKPPQNLPDDPGFAPPPDPPEDNEPKANDAQCQAWSDEEDRLVDARRQMNRQEKINDPNLPRLLELIQLQAKHC